MNIRCRLEGKVFQFTAPTLDKRHSFSNPEFIDMLGAWCEQNDCAIGAFTPSDVSIIVVGNYWKRTRQLKKLIKEFFTQQTN